MTGETRAADYQRSDFYYPSSSMQSDEFEIFREAGNDDAKGEPDLRTELPTVLIIDDDSSLLDSLRMSLRDQYNTILAHDPVNCLDQLDMNVSAVVLDIKMPGRSGFEVIEEIKYRFAQLPVIFHSAYQDLKDPIEILNEHHPFAYIVKGAGLHHLMSTLHSAIEYYEQFRFNRKLVEELTRVNRGLEERVKERTRQLEEANERLQHTAITDPLTGLFNRRFLIDTLDKEIAILNEGEGDTPAAFLILDVDHFKSINDEYGHDDVLRSVSRCLLDGVREGDVVARYGGEEFTVFMPNTAAEDALKTAESLREQLAAETIRRAGHTLTVTASFGVTAVRAGDTSDSLVQRADVALYRAKNGGRNRVVSADQ